MPCRAVLWRAMEEGEAQAGRQAEGERKEKKKVARSVSHQSLCIAAAACSWKGGSAPLLNNCVPSSNTKNTRAPTCKGTLIWTRHNRSLHACSVCMEGSLAGWRAGWLAGWLCGRVLSFQVGQIH